MQETAKLETEAEKKKLDEKACRQSANHQRDQGAGNGRGGDNGEVTALQADSTKAIEDYGTAGWQKSAPKSQTEVQAMIDAHAAKYPEAKAGGR